MADEQRTVLHDRHVSLSAKMAPFGGWSMPIQYPIGAVAEHLATRRSAGLFDVSHMGRLRVRGNGATAFLQYALTNSAADLPEWAAHYTILATPTGGAIDDAFLYRHSGNDFLLVVNAANAGKDWEHLNTILTACDFSDVELTDITTEMAMLALQGPTSQDILTSLGVGGDLPQPKRNAVSHAALADVATMIARTGYTGERVCFELFVPTEHVERLWDSLIAAGATPVGLAARDTLRLEASLPLYGHELGLDADGNEIPILASPASRLAVSYSKQDDYIGRDAIARVACPAKRIRSVALTGRGVAREGATVTKDGRTVGAVTSGTMVPVPLDADTHEFHAAALAYVDSKLAEGDDVNVTVRGKSIPAVIVPGHLKQ